MLIKVLVLSLVSIAASADHKEPAYTGPYYNGSYVGKIYGGSPVPPKYEDKYRDRYIEQDHKDYIRKRYTDEMKRDEE